MSSGLLEPPEEEPLGVLLRDEGEEEEVRRKEVGCQWESPEEEKREVGCQSDSVESRDAAVQVDLLTQQLSWRHSGSSAMLLQCFAVRPDGPDGGALLQHCTTNRTRTRAIKPAIKHQTQKHLPCSSSSPKLPQPRTRPQRRRRAPRKIDEQQSATPPRPGPRRRQQRRASPVPNTEQQQGEEEEVLEEDTVDPTWTPPEADMSHPSPSSLEDGEQDSQHAPLCVKLEPDSTMCDVCGKVMRNKSSLARHSFIHTGKKPYGCHLCELRFNRRDNLQHHLNRLHPNGVTKLEKQRKLQTWLCEVCGKTFRCRSALKTHEVIHLGIKPFRCDLCPKAYMRTNDLEHHKKIVHVDGGEAAQRSGTLLCDLCGKEFKFRSQLAVHFQTHTGERPHLCDICGRKFCRQYQLERHKILMHSNQASSEENPTADAGFACGVCGRRLKSQALLAAHSRIHTGDKPHRCGICLRSFLRATCLKQHHLRVHLKVRGNEAAARRRHQAAAKAFPCPICSKVFKFRSLLASHSVIHSEVRPHACDFCSRSFRRLSHLKRHREVVHANGARLPQNFVCHICGKDKKCRSQLARHVIIHTGERPFACDLCSARFNRRGNLQQHRKRMHAVGQPPTEEDPPILFDDDDVASSLAYKEEETVVAVDAAAEEVEVAASDETDAT